MAYQPDTADKLSDQVVKMYLLVFLLDKSLEDREHCVLWYAYNKLF